MEDQKYRLSKTEEKDGVRKTVSVEEVENGFVITVEISKMLEDRYECDIKKYISKTNPFVEEEEVDDTQSIVKSLKSLF
jgi:hypothetical protein